jgi:hypothetical protein
MLKVNPAMEELTEMVPEGILQVGCVVTVAVGAIGDAGCAFTVTLEDATEVQEPFETVKV